MNNLISGLISYRATILTITLTLILVTVVRAQLPINELQKKFEQSVSNVYQEKVFVHTDRSIYITGETIWMSATCMDAMFHTPVGLSKVLNVELIDHTGKPVERIRLNLQDGRGSGQIFVSPNLQSGHYWLRAYTNWMKNFDSHYVFKKQIGIINPSAARSEELPLRSDSLKLSFFPEGGHLVNGLTSKVVVKVSGEYGASLDYSGLIFDGNDREVVEFKTSDNGFGSFLLQPEAGKSYVARIKRDSVIYSYPLNTALDAGVVLMKSNDRNGDFRFSLSASGIDMTCYLIVHTRGKMKEIKSIDLKAENDFVVPYNSLSPGITHVTIMNSQFQPLAQRLIFKPMEEAPLANLQLAKPVFEQREKVELTLRPEADLGSDVAHLSISVYRTDPHLNPSETIRRHVLLTSDLPNIDKNTREQEMDLSLLSEDWHRFDWENMWRVIDLPYPAEVHSPLLQGELLATNENNSVRNLMVDFIGTTSVMSSVTLGTERSFTLEIPARVRNDKVHFFNIYQDLSGDPILIESPFLAVDTTQKTTLPLQFSPDLKEYIERLNTNIQVAQVYREFNPINGVLPTLEEPKTNFFGEADHLYELDEYTRFETVKDLFIEYIRWAVIKNNNTREDGFYVANEDLLPEKAFTTIDGVPVKEVATMLNFDPLKIKKIELVDDYYFVGSTRLSGVVNFSTYEGDFDQRELPQSFLEKPYYGPQLTRTFYSPNYDLDSDQLRTIPDYRNTLYWNPQVVLEKDQPISLEFFTSDDSGTYRVEVNGMTNSGIPVSLSKEFSVK